MVYDSILLHYTKLLSAFALMFRVRCAFVILVCFICRRLHNYSSHSTSQIFFSLIFSTLYILLSAVSESGRMMSLQIAISVWKHSVKGGNVKYTHVYTWVHAFVASHKHNCLCMCLFTNLKKYTLALVRLKLYSGKSLCTILILQRGQLVMIEFPIAIFQMRLKLAIMHLSSPTDMYVDITNIYRTHLYMPKT